MRSKLGVVLLGLTVGGATFLAVGVASFITIAQLQYSTMQTRVAQAALGANQVSTRAKNAPVMAGGNRIEERYDLVSNAP